MEVAPKMIKRHFLLVLTLMCASSFFVDGADSPEQIQFHQYWYQQKAELARYALSQARYGEIHKGESVLIFVTEPFLKDKQVKYEFGDKTNSIPVLKMNFTRKFYTGIYPYSVMTSVFSPLDYQKLRTLKVTSSSQEWCGNTFMQLNNRNGKYHAEIRSYFQKEGDQDFDLNYAWLEDELWTRIRMAPSTLPIGEIDLIPGLQFIRLWHFDMKAEKATAEMSSVTDRKLSTKPINVYTISYKNIPRKVVIKFEKEFPYAIVAWAETQPGGFSGSKLLTTEAVLTKRILLDYWNRHNLEDDHYRKELGLTQQ
jgi:hypothetical protein